MNKKNLNGWALSEQAMKWIYDNIPEGSTVLELGSGTGTKELVKKYTVYSVESNVSWFGLVPESNYIHCPLTTYVANSGERFKWYKTSVLVEKMPDNYDFLIIDAPVGEDRVNILHFLHLFNFDVPVLIDDTHRGLDRDMALKIALFKKKDFDEFVGREKNFIILK